MIRDCKSINDAKMILQFFPPIKVIRIVQEISLYPKEYDDKKDALCLKAKQLLNYLKILRSEEEYPELWI